MLQILLLSRLVCTSFPYFHRQSHSNVKNHKKEAVAHNVRMSSEIILPFYQSVWCDSSEKHNTLG